MGSLRITYRSVLDDMERHADKQHGPLTFTQMEAFGDQLRIALESRQLPSVPPAKPKNAAPAAQTGDIEARLRKLEALPPKPPDKPITPSGSMTAQSSVES